VSVAGASASGLKWTAIAKLLTQIINWVITFLVVRLLVPEDYGLMAIALSILAVMSTIADLGLGSALVQVESLPRAELESVAGAAIVSNLLIGAAIIAAAPLAHHVIADSRATLVIQLCALQFCFLAVSMVPQALMTRELQFKSIAIVEVSAGLITNSSVLLLAWLGAGVWALVIGSLLGVAGRALISLSIGGWVSPRFQTRGLSHHFKFGGAITASRLVWQLTSQLDVLIAGKNLGAAATGVYSVALNLASLPMQKIMAVVNQVVFPSMSRLQNDALALRQYVLQSLRFVAFCGIPIAFGLGMVGRDLVMIAYGQKWAGVIAPLQVLCLVIPIRMLGALLMTASAAKGRAAVEIRNMLPSLIVLPIAFLVGVRWGAVGLAWAWFVAVCISYTYVIPRVSKLLEVPLKDMLTVVFPSFISGLFMVGGLALLIYLLRDAGQTIRLLACVIAGVTLYSGAITATDRAIWRDCKTFIKGN
jgi:teichuronic acid exporter